MKRSQSQRVLSYIKRYGKINRLKSVYTLGIFELARCIRDLEKNGYRFIKKGVTVENKNGVKIYCKEYSLA